MAAKNSKGKKSAKKTVSKPVAKKPVSKAVSKRPVKVSTAQVARTVKKVTPTKRIRKQVKALRKEVKQEAKKTDSTAKRVSNVSKKTQATSKRVTKVSKATTATADKVAKVAAKTTKINADLQKLKESLASQRKTKTPKKQLNEYNLFMRRQLNEGKTFNQAVNLWKRLRKVEGGKLLVKTRTKTVVKTVKVADKKQQAHLTRLQKELDSLSKKKTPKKQLNEYNLFMRRQLNDGKTFPQAVRLWKQVKQVEKGKLPTKTRTVTKTIVKRVPSKPKIVTRVKRIVKTKPVIQYKTKVEQVKVRDPELEKQVVEKEGALQRLRFETEKQRLEHHSMVESLQQRHESDLTSERQKRELELLAEQQRAAEESTRLRQELEREIVKLKGDLALAHQSFEEKSRALQKAMRVPPSVRSSGEVPPERVAHLVLETFFGEISHVGFKRGLSLDDVVNAYFYALAQVVQRMGVSAVNALSNEEASHQIVHLYFKEIASHRTKRRTDLDEVMNAYFYVLDKMNSKEELLTRAQAQLERSNPPALPEKASEQKTSP
ncbi:MAG: hypothetical protein J4215_01100 [Candidatus Diapherotrites archaeon]|uniref:Uncharacterized protein n=1 Tax=Candidatus Iainarchaeum sp. TaxID=3101447 RepID=A0A8T4L311_9ARCH|nr:hypothetical protein [Candidatus Diapherotrites archaeon]